MIRPLALVLIVNLVACSTTSLQLRNGQSIDGTIEGSDADFIYVRNRMESISTTERSSVMEIDYAGRREIIAGAIVTSLGLLALLAGLLASSLAGREHMAGDMIMGMCGAVGGTLTLIGVPILVFGVNAKSRAKRLLRSDVVSLHVSTNGFALRF